MADLLTSNQRHQCMSRIRGKNTKPEILVRKSLHARGFRFRLHNNKLPGSSDIVLPKYGVVIMVNGCFWHGHKGCRYATKPKTNIDFWETKIARNRHRDEVTTAYLEALGWTVITIWECELRPGVQLQNRLDNLAEEIRHEDDLMMVLEDERRRRMCTPNKFRMAETMCRILLRAEASSLYSIQKVVKTLYEIY